jgi:hypothetical protein
MIMVWHIDPECIKLIETNLGRQMTGAEFISRVTKIRTTSAVSAGALVRHMRQKGEMADWEEIYE